MVYKFLDQILQATTKDELFAIAGAVATEYEKDNLSKDQYYDLIEIINIRCNYMQEV